MDRPHHGGFGPQGAQGAPKGSENRPKSDFFQQVQCSVGGSLFCAAPIAMDLGPKGPLGAPFVMDPFVMDPFGMP